MFLSLDFVYIPSKHPDREVAYYTDILGGTLVFRIKEMGTEVSAVRLSEHRPLVLLAEHLGDDVPILIYRVEDLEQEIDTLEKRNWTRGQMLEIPHGPCCSFTAEGGQRIAIYELTRPGVAKHVEGRFD